MVWYNMNPMYFLHVYVVAPWQSLVCSKEAKGKLLADTHAVFCCCVVTDIDLFILFAHNGSEYNGKHNAIRRSL